MHSLPFLAMYECPKLVRATIFWPDGATCVYSYYLAPIYSGDGANRTICYANDHPGKGRPEECYSFETGTLEFNDGAACKTDCEEVRDCHSCVARSMCQWCREEIQQKFWMLGYF